MALAACSTPVLAAAFWLMTGVTGPVAPASGQTVPEIVSVSAGGGLQARTLVLRTRRRPAALLGADGSRPVARDPDLLPPAPAQRALGAAVATLVAPAGGDAADQVQALAAVRHRLRADAGAGQSGPGPPA